MQNAPDACNVLQTCVAVISALSDFTSTLDVAPLQQQLRHLVAQVHDHDMALCSWLPVQCAAQESIRWPYSTTSVLDNGVSVVCTL